MQDSNVAASDGAETEECETTIADLQAQLDQLKDDLRSLADSHDAYKNHVVKPRLDDLEADRDDAREERAELQQQIHALEEELTHLTAKVESLIGLADDEESNPTKRVADLRQALIRRAEDRSDIDVDRASMYWEEVQDLFSDLGHGDISRPDCYKAMRDAADAPGFKEGTKNSRHGNDVKAILVDLDALHGSASCRSPTTRDGVSDTESARADGGERNQA